MAAFNIEAPIAVIALLAQSSVLEQLDLRPELDTVVNFSPIGLESKRFELFTAVIIFINGVDSLDFFRGSMILGFFSHEIYSATQVLLPVFLFHLVDKTGCL